MKIRLRVVSLVSILAWLSWVPLHASTPVPTYGTYFGTGDSNYYAAAVGLDPSGYIIMAGATTSQTLPGTANAFQPMKTIGFPGNENGFIAKFDPTGRTLIWASFLDGAPTAVAVDPTGCVYVVASGFAAKISADGTMLLYSTYLPGTPTALAVSSVGEAYIVGSFSPTVITPGALGAGANPDETTAGVFLLRLNSTGTSLVFGAYLGGGGLGTTSTSVTIDQQGNAYVAGYTGGLSMPTLRTANAFQGQLSNGTNSGFIVEVNSDGSQLLYGTYFGPQYSSTQITSLAVAPDGSLYFSGTTNTTALLATPGAYLATPSPGFIAKLTVGKLTLDSFSYLDVSPGSFSLQIGNIGNEPQTLYAFNANGVVELSVPELSLVSSFTTSSFEISGAVLTAPHSFWLVGSCQPCSLGNLISSDAFQSEPNNPPPKISLVDAAIVQLTDISPTVSFLGSSATSTSPFAAGQLVSIYGTQMGPPAGSEIQIGPDGTVTTMNGGTQVLFDGVAVPILFTSATQVNAAIPCSVAGQSSTQMVVEYLGAQSGPLTVALGPAAPGIFTDDGSGTGQGAILNQDYSFNSASNPAPRGSVAIFYATGVGPASPCTDGQIYESNFPTLTLPVIVGVGNTGAHVLYAGQAPDLVSGVAQFNIVIPSDAATGILPLTLVVDGIFSKEGVTIAVK